MIRKAPRLIDDVALLCKEHRPRQSRSVGESWELVVAEAGYIGGLDGGGMVGLVFGEADGEVLDTVCHAEFFEE